MAKILVVLVVILSNMVVGLILSYPFMLLWNWCLVGAVAGVSEIGWLQAYGLYLMATFLFKTNVSSK